MKLYFFPAFLPLAEALPWLLTAFGAFAGFVLGSRTSNRAVIWAARGLCLALLVGGTAYAWPRLRWKLHARESRLTELPELTVLGEAVPAESAPAVPFRAEWREAWQVKPSTRALSNPVRAGALLLLGTWENSVEAVSIRNGAPVWRVQKKEPVYSLALASPTLLLAGEGLHASPSSALTAIELPSGRALWSREFAGHIESAPTAFGEKIWVGTGPAGLWCLSARDGAVLWHSSSGHVDSTPLLEGETLYFSSQPDETKEEATFWALDSATGSEKWKLALPGQPWGSPRFFGKLLVTSTGIGQIGVPKPEDKGWVHGIDVGARKLLWSTELGGNPIEASVPVGDLAVFALTKGELVAVRTSTGAVAWRRPLPQTVEAEPVGEPGSGTVAVTGTLGHFTLVNGHTGAVLAEHDYEAGINSALLFLPDGAVLASPSVLRRFQW